MDDALVRERMNTVLRDMNNAGRSHLNSDVEADPLELFTVMEGQETPQLKHVLESMDIKMEHHVARLDTSKYILQRQSTISFVYLADDE